MGVLGEWDRMTILADLRDQAARYMAADPARPVVSAFELVAVVADRTPGPTGHYRTRMSPRLLDDWVKFTEEEGVVLILDVQPGRSDCMREVEQLYPWLRRPHVHLALDPEWAMRPDGVPGAEVGRLQASEIGRVQDALAGLVTTEQLPPKLLVVHQFLRAMIVGKESLRSIPEVQLVIDADGFGRRDLKTEVYHALLREESVGFAGIKLFYKQDHDLLQPEEVVVLTPSPDLVVYQ
jgi:hypothetical protein